MQTVIHDCFLVPRHYGYSGQTKINVSKLELLTTIPIFLVYTSDSVVHDCVFFICLATSTCHEV